MIRVVSYNVHACIGTDGVFAPQRIARVLQQLAPDFVALQEVEDRLYEGRLVSDLLAETLGLHAYHGPALTRDDAQYGNLLLAKVPALEWQMHDISVPRCEPRSAIEGVFAIGDARLFLVATHLSLRASQRKQQVRQLLELFASHDADLKILAGDINEWQPRAYTTRVLAHAFEARSYRRTFPARSPALALDRIYVNPGEAVAGFHADRTPPSRRASDHLPLICDLELDFPSS